MTKRTKRALRIALVVVLTPILLVLTLAMAIFLEPGLIWNRTVFEWARPRIESAGEFRLSYDELRLKAGSQSLRAKRFALSGQDVCADLASIESPICLKDVDLDVRVSFYAFPFQVGVFLHKVVAEAAPIKGLETSPDATDAAAAPIESEPTRSALWPTWLRGLSWNEIDLRVPSFERGHATERETVSARIRSTSPERMFFEVEWGRPQSRDLVRARVDLDSDLARTGRIDQASTNLTARAEAKIGQLTAQASTRARLQGFRFEVALNGEGRLASLGRSAIELKECLIRGEAQPDAAPLPLRELGVSCPLKGRVTALRQKPWMRRVPQTLRAKLDASYESRPDGPPAIRAGLALERAHQGPFDIDLSLATDKATTYTDAGLDVPGIDVTGRLAVPDARDLIHFANGLGFLVPAPLHVFQGGIDLEFAGKTEGLRPFGSFRADLKTRLRSEVQSLRIVASSDIAIKDCRPPLARGSIQVVTSLNDVQLELPPIDYTNPPPLMPDKRFVLGEEAQAPREDPGCPLDFEFLVRTPSDRPLRLVGGPFKKALPVSLNVAGGASKPVSGEVRIDNFTTEIFRRQATLEKLRYDIGGNLLEARARVDYADYRIRALATGRPDSLRVDFESDPPLTRQQAIAALLFGSPLEGLDEDQSGSVANAEAAAASGALTLASLYLFASTPVEAIGYNPHTQGLTARVKLASGTSLTVGANDQGVTDLGLRRRLARNWRLETTVRNPNEPASRATTSLLEWFTRF